MGCRGQRPQLVCHQQPLPLKVAHSFSGCGDHGLIYNLNRLFAQIFYYLFTPQPGGLTPQLRTGRSLGWGRNSEDGTVGAKRGAEGWVSWGLGPGCWRLGPSRGRREGLDLQSWGRGAEGWVLEPGCWRRVATGWVLRPGCWRLGPTRWRRENFRVLNWQEFRVGAKQWGRNGWGQTGRRRLG